MAKKDILSTSEFLSTMRKTPLGSTTNLTFSDAEALSRSGIDISNYGNATETNEFSDALVKEKQESSGWWDEAIGTLDNLANNFGRGFVGMFEGIVDFAVSLAGNVGSWFGADTQWAEDFIDIDFAGKMADWTQLFTPWSMIRNSVKYGTEYWDDVGKTAWGFLPFTTGMGGFMVSDEEMAEWMDKYTYSSDWLEEDSGWFGDIAQNVSQGVGQLVGMYLTGGIGKAAGLGAKGAQAVSLGAMSIGAAGKGTEEALNEGANLGQATVYGLLSGATEAATEMLGGVAGDFATGVIGKAALKNAAVRKFTSTLAGKMIAGFISEGFEEVLSDVVNPLWKKISYDYDLDLANEYSSGEFWAGLAQSFVVGGIVGAIGTGVTYQKLGKTTINDKKVGQKAAIAYGEYADNIDDLHKAAKKLNKTFSQIVEEANIDIAERTNIDKALEQVRTNPDLTETHRSKLERAIKKAYEANTQYMESQNKLLGELESAGITAEDLAQDYQNKLNKKAQEVAEKYDIDIENADAVNDAIKSNTEIMNDITEGNVGSFYDNNGKLVVVGQNAVAEQLALNSMEQLKTKNVDIYNDFMDIADTLMTMDETFSTQVDKFAQIYQTQNNMSLDEATTLAKQTAMANRIASYYANKPSALSSVDNLRKIADIMENALLEQYNESEVNINGSEQETTKGFTTGLQANGQSSFFGREGTWQNYIEEVRRNPNNYESRRVGELTLQIIKPELLPDFAQSIIEDNQKLGFNTQFAIDFNYNNAVAFHENSTITLSMSEFSSYQEMIQFNNHERLHATANLTAGVNYRIALTNYLISHVSEATTIFNDIVNRYGFLDNSNVNMLYEEIFADVYSGYVQLEDSKYQEQIRNELNDALNVSKESFNGEFGIKKEAATPDPMLPIETTNPIEVMDEQMGALVRTMEEPALQKKIRVGKSNIKSTATWLDNISYNTETLAVKLTNSAHSIEKGFKTFGYSTRDAMLKVEKVRMANSIGNNVCLDGFYTTNNNGTITRTTLGLRNGKTGIADILEKSFRGDLRGANAKKAVEQGFSTFYESLALYVEQDRLNASLGTELVALEDIAKLNEQQSSQSERKTVFGRWLETRTMPSDLLVEISENLPLLSEAISKGVALDEATFKTLAHKTALENNVELSGDALETYNKAKDYLRLLNQEDIDTRLAEIDKDFPQFKEIREEVWKINRELLKMQYESGYLSKEAYEWMKKNYSHYVPTYREMIMRTNSTISMSLDASTLKAAKGSDLVIRDIFDSMQSQIIKIEQKVALNELIKDFINAGKGQDTLNRYIIGEEITNETQLPRSTDSSMTYYLSRPALDGNMLTYYEGGQAHTYLVNNNVMEGFQSLAGVYRQTLLEIPGMKFMAKAQGLVKNLLTTYNPFFSLRNAIRDLWDASFYSPTGMTSVLRNLPKAYKSIITNDANYQAFVAIGGIGSSIMTTTDIYTEKPKRSNTLEYIIKPWKAIQRVNEVIETSTRYAQYLATTEKLFKERAKGKNDYSNKQIMTRGVYEAHEITLNFSRAGTVTRQINNTFGMFLNANIQGFTKMARTFISPKSAKEWAELIFKCVILGIGTQLLNELLYYDDEDYKALNTSIKNNYYLIKAGDQFIRIPKGRVISAFNAFVTAGFNYENGDENAFQDALSYALEANAPISGFGFGFFQGIADATMNRTWYGGEIVGSEWDNTRPSEQYKKSTSNISKWLGKVFNVSPLKIEYVLDQYSGIVGDILLPMTSDEGGFDKLKQIVKDQYLIDPTEKSRYSSDFYNYREQVLYDKTDGDAIATIQASYMTTAVSEIKELRAQIEEIENNSNLSSSEKEAQTKTIRVMINASYKSALQNAKDIGEALKNYTITEENAAEVQREVYREVLGAESALRLYNKKLYSKAKSYYKAGVSYDDFYVYYFNLREMSTKAEAETYISRLRLSANLKNLLYRLAGWSLDDEKIELLTAWLKRKGLTDEEIDMIL